MQRGKSSLSLEDLRSHYTQEA